jgi:Domain of unknown function (DUF4384)/Putative zinc-finger
MRRHSESCVSNLKLDRLLAGELTPDEQRAVEAHVESCDSCQQRHVTLAESRRSFPRDAPPFAAIERSATSPSPRVLDPTRRTESITSSRPKFAPQPPRSERSAWLVIAPALAAAAAIALAIAEPWTPSVPSARDTTGSGTRTKGGPASLGWVVRRGEHVFAGRPEQPVRAGDAVRFSISAREPVYVAILGVDPKGRLSVFYPEGDQLAKVEAGRDQLLPAAIEVDMAAGAEQLYAVFCTSAVALSPVRDAIERSADAPALPGGCSIEHSTLNEVAP